ncbi:hypothetical protein HY640_00145 [Candidatus Woesearchaeota archaeon]|nr:hypothetical protein [Candidatus Woesearchaeota archaeon]
MNGPLNRIVAGHPDKSCVSDSDCIMRQVDCDSCSYGSSGEAVNKDWKPFCLISLKNYVICPQALSRWSLQEVMCESGQCKSFSGS